MSRMPNFIVIGAMKCATSTLHAQLALQPGIFMCTPKEPYFFSNDEVWSRGLDWYSSLFTPAGKDDLCGESSTHYTKLPTYPHTIERIRKHAPQTKFIYIIRHPIDRLISQYIHEWTEAVISCPIDEAIDRHPELIDYSRYGMQLKPFLETFGPSQILVLFFEQFTRQPQPQLERVCRFIGYPGVPQWKEEIGAQNVSAERLRRSSLRDAIINLPGATFLRRTLVPQSIRDRIKSWWTMQKRPRLSESSLARLRALFDPDLAELGRSLGMDLTCETYKQVVTRTDKTASMQQSAA
jgi:hypothetical protein